MNEPELSSNEACDQVEMGEPADIEDDGAIPDVPNDPVPEVSAAG